MLDCLAMRWLALLGLTVVPILAGCSRIQPSPRTWKTDPAAFAHPEDQPGEAAAYYVEKRAPDLKNLPVERYFTAMERLRRMPVYSSAGRRFKSGGRREASLGAWQELGPGNVGGRTRALVIHPGDPNTMYAGGVAGGVWKTTDGAGSWAPLDDLLPNMAITTLAMDPRNPDALYAGTGENFNGDGVRGAGIFKTEDAGKTWRRLAQTASSPFYYVAKIVVSPNDSSRVYAATYGGVWRSLDGGASWTRELNRTAPETGCQDLAIRGDQASDFLFAACGLNRQATIFRNTDAGGEGRWMPVFTEPNMDRTSLALAPSNQSIVYAMAASLESGDRRDGLLAVYRSSSNGDPSSWEARVRNTSDNRLNTALLSNPREFFIDVCSGGRQAFFNQGRYDNVIAVDPLDPERIWAGGIDLFRSDDGGANWGLASYWSTRGLPQYSHADHHAIVFHPQYDGAENQILFDANDGGIHRSDNARADAALGPRAACSASNSSVIWKPLNSNYGVTQFYHGLPYPGGNLYFGGTQDNGTQLGDDAHGANDWVRVFSGDGGYVAVDPANANTVYVETTNLSLRRSTDGGITFLAATRGITEPGANFAFIAPFAMDPNDSKRLWIGGRTLWRTADGAQNWERAGKAIDSGNFRAIAVAPGDSKRVLAGASTGFLYRQADALAADENTEWSSARPRTGVISWIAFEPGNPDVAYATYSTFDSTGQTGHVFRSTDGGVNWSSIDGTGDTAIPDIPVHCILVDPDNAQTLYLGTDLGVFVSLDGGGAWFKEDTGFPNTVVESLAIDRSGGGSTLFAFTHGRGVWRVRLNGVAPCGYKIGPSTAPLEAFGGLEGSIDVATADNCAWSAVGDVGWMVPSPANGTGNGTVRMQLPVNTSTRPRGGAIVIADKQIPITQAGASAAGNNDDMARPQAIARLPYVGVQDTRSATSELADPRHSCTSAPDSKTVWFRFSAPASGTVEVRATGARFVLTAYPQNGTAPGGELACNAGTTAQIRVPVTSGQNYLIQVSGEGPASAGGNLVLTAGRVQ